MDPPCGWRAPSRASSDELLVDPRAGVMSFPTRLLGPGEEVHLDSRPNWSYLFWPSVFTVLVLAGCVATVVLWTSAPLVAGWVLLGVGLAALA